jgi:hypothetical protein
MEFIAKIPDNLPEIIENNGEEVKAWLRDVMQKYEGLVVTPESIKSAKEDKAKLNKLRTALEERRKEVKRDYLAPYQRFEENYKELLALIDKPIAGIDSQIRALDEQERQQKYDRLKAYFGQCVTGAAPNDAAFIRFEDILNPKWANKTLSESKLEQELCDTVTRIYGERDELAKLYSGSKHLTAILAEFGKRYDKSAAMAYAEQLRLAEEQQAARAAQEAEREAAFAQRKAAAISALNSAAEQGIPVTPEPPEPPVHTAQPLLRGTFRVEGTRNQIIALREFMKQQGISFEIVKA